MSLNVFPAYEQYRKDGAGLGAVLDGVAAEAARAAASVPDFDAADITDYAKMKDRLTMQVVPVWPNREMLENIPHRTVEDMAVVYRVELDGDSATALVTNRLLGQYGVSPDQLHADAVWSQLAAHPPVLRNMAEVMAEMSGGMLDLPESPLWVATTEDGVNGASVTQLPGFLAEAAERLGGDYFVLPSSVHEVLFIRDDGSFTREELEDMVRRVNATEVSEADYLSDSVYHYDSAGRVFERATAFEARTAEEPERCGAAPAKDTLSVLLVEPDRYPRPVEIDASLEALQDAVGGFIEVTYPFDEAVGLVMNEEGKIDGLPLNRALRDEDGDVYDIVAGPFLVVGLTDGDFRSLTPEQMETYSAMFHSPEIFVRMGKGFLALPVPDAMVAKQDEKTPGAPELAPRGKTKEEAR